MNTGTRRNDGEFGKSLYLPWRDAFEDLTALLAPRRAQRRGALLHRHPCAGQVEHLALGFDLGVTGRGEEAVTNRACCPAWPKP
jgi:hypothetical protein